jgi:hypothetical protein
MGEVDAYHSSSMGGWQGRVRILRHAVVPFWSSFLADARHLPTRQASGGPPLNFHGNRDNLHESRIPIEWLVLRPKPLDHRPEPACSTHGAAPAAEGPGAPGSAISLIGRLPRVVSMPQARQSGSGAKEAA